MDHRIREAIGFALSLVGVPYRWATPDTDMTADESPFHVGIEPKASVKSVSCTGLLNLIMRHVGLGAEIPGARYPGGTVEWFRKLKEAGMLDKFDSSKTYPIGTLFWHPFEDYENNQGHVAILVRPAENVYDSLIIHSYSATPYDPNHLDSKPGVALEKLGISHFSWADFEYTCHPKDWLSGKPPL